MRFMSIMDKAMIDHTYLTVAYTVASAKSTAESALTSVGLLASHASLIGLHYQTYT